MGFSLDLELKGAVEVQGSVASMLGTKLEVKLKKAEAGSWAKLDIPKVVQKVEEKQEAPSIADLANKELWWTVWTWRIWTSHRRNSSYLMLPKLNRITE